MSRPLTVFDIPLGLGAPYTGVEQGPAEIRATNGYHALHDQHDVSEVVVHFPHPDSQMIEGIRDTIEKTPDTLGFPIFLGGDHSASIASVGALAGDEDMGLLWIDAHADFNTPHSSPSGHLHGMVVASLLGDGPEPDWKAEALSEENIAMVGLSNVDREEQKRLSESDVSTYSMEEIDANGFAPTLEKAWDSVSGGVDSIHASLDMDVFAPEIAPGVSVAEPSGLSYEDGLHLARFLSENHQSLSAIDIMELNPLRDQHGKTASLAGELLAESIPEWSR